MVASASGPVYQQTIAANQRVQVPAEGWLNPKEQQVLRIAFRRLPERLTNTLLPRTVPPAVADQTEGERVAPKAKAAAPPPARSAAVAGYAASEGDNASLSFEIILRKK
jgi:hypothetical protein